MRHILEDQAQWREIMLSGAMKYAGTTLTCQTHVKYLGIELHQSLTGERVADKSSCKSNAKIKFLYRQTKT